jgi:hypothetical protein
VELIPLGCEAHEFDLYLLGMMVVEGRGRRGCTLIREWNVAADIPHFRKKIFISVIYLFE